MRKKPRSKGAGPSFRHITGAFLPEPAVRELIRHDLSDDTLFRNWLGDALNGYLVRAYAAESVPPPSESLKILDELHGSIEQLSASLSSIELSERPAIHLQCATHHSFGEQWSDMADRLQQELTKAASAVISARATIDEQPNEAGANQNAREIASCRSL